MCCTCDLCCICAMCRTCWLCIDEGECSHGSQDYRLQECTSVWVVYVRNIDTLAKLWRGKYREVRQIIQKDIIRLSRTVHVQFCVCVCSDVSAWCIPDVEGECVDCIPHCRDVASVEPCHVAAVHTMTSRYIKVFMRYWCISCQCANRSWVSVANAISHGGNIQYLTHARTKDITDDTMHCWSEQVSHLYLNLERMLGSRPNVIG